MPWIRLAAGACTGFLVLVVGVDTFADVVLHQRQVADRGGLERSLSRLRTCGPRVETAANGNAWPARRTLP